MQAGFAIVGCLRMRSRYVVSLAAEASEGEGEGEREREREGGWAKKELE